MKKEQTMAKVGIVMGSDSDMPIMEKLQMYSRNLELTLI